MSSSSPRRHDSPVTQKPPVPEPTYAERARTLAYRNRIGSLSTLSRKLPGWPFGSIMPYGLDGRGRPIFLISTMAMHTQNLVQDPRASLLITQPDIVGDPLGASRLTLMGKVSKVPEADLPQARERYLARHQNASYWVDFDDFSFYQMEIVDAYFVGGFAVMGWMTADEYYQAEADPLADATSRILQHMNTDHADSLILLARVFGGVDAEEATMTAVDRLGFHIRLKTGDRLQGLRIGFIHEVRTPQETRAVLVEMVQQAREKIHAACIE